MSQRVGRTAASVARIWHHVDAGKDDRTLGRLATSIAVTLTGKHKPVYDPTFDQGDYVVVTNCSKLKLSGNKFDDKLYWRHSTKPGHLKLTPLKKLVADKGYGEILKKAVSGMLPKNSYRQVRLDRLKVFDGTENPYKENIVAFHDEQPQVLTKIKELESNK
jgi:large subunit ribosomal protein L13